MKKVVLFLWTWGLRVVEVGVSGHQYFLNRGVTSWDWHFKRTTVAWKTWLIFLFLCSFISSNASFITNPLCGLGQVSDTLHTLGVSGTECGLQCLPVLLY